MREISTGLFVFPVECREAKLRRLSLQNRVEQKNCIFLIRRIFWWRAQISNCKDNFSARRAVPRHGGEAEPLVSFSNSW